MHPSLRRRSGLGVGYVLFAALFAAQASIMVLSPILPQIAEEFGVGTAGAAQLRSVSGVTAAVFALVLAVRGNRFRLSTLLYAGLALFAVAALTCAVAPTFAVMIGAHVVIGLGLAAVLSGGVAASEVWAADGQASRVLSWALIGQPVAWVVGQPIVGLVSQGSWRWAWVVMPLASSLVALAALALRDTSISDEGQRCDPYGLWQEPGVKRWATSELLAFAAWGGALTYSGAVFIQAYDLGVGKVGLILGVGAVFYLPGNFLGRRWLEKGTGLLLVGFSLAAAVAVGVFSSARTGLATAVVVFAVAVFFDGGRTIAGAAMGLGISNGRRLAAMSLRTSATQLGYLLGASLGGILLDQWGFVGIGLGFGLLFATAGLIQVPATRSQAPSLASAHRFLRRYQHQA